MHRLSSVKFPNILQLRHITHIRGIRSIGKQQGRGSQTQHDVMNEEKLIVEVEKNDIVYDPKHPYYKDTGRKDKPFTREPPRMPSPNGLSAARRVQWVLKFGARSRRWTAAMIGCLTCLQNIVVCVFVFSN